MVARDSALRPKHKEPPRVLRLPLLSSTDRPLHPCARGPFAEQILFDEFLDFPSGYQDPQQTISICSAKHQPSCQPQPNGCSCSSLHDNSTTDSDLLVQAASCGWDQLSSFSSSYDSSGVTSIPFTSSASSLTSLTDDLHATPNLLYNTSDWNAFSLQPDPITFPSDGLSTYPLVSTGGLDVLNMPSLSENIYNTHMSQTMEKGT